VVLGLVSALYALFGVVFVLAHVPQLRAVWRGRCVLHSPFGLSLYSRSP